jgi:hypothetical protein
MEPTTEELDVGIKKLKSNMAPGINVIETIIEEDGVH